MKATGAPEAEGQQLRLCRQAVIVERVVSVGDEDVVADEARRRLDSAGMESKVCVAIEECKGQDLAGAVGEELAVRPVPSSNWVVLDIDLR